MYQEKDQLIEATVELIATDFSRTRKATIFTNGFLFLTVIRNNVVINGSNFYLYDFRMWKLVCLCVALVANSILVNCDQIYVRSHGEAQEPQEKTFETVVGLNVVQPKKRLRVRTRVPKKESTTEAIQAARAAGLVAKELQKKEAAYRDLDSVESSRVPVSYSCARF